MFFEPKEKFGFVVITNGSDPRYTEGFNAVIRNTVNILYESFVAK
jgi:hypothetical protein